VTELQLAPLLSVNRVFLSSFSRIGLAERSITFAFVIHKATIACTVKSNRSSGFELLTDELYCNHLF